MPQVRRLVVVLPSLAVLCFCACRPADPHDSDWSKIRREADAYAKSSVLWDVRSHLKKYPGCLHRAAAEEYLAESCRMVQPLGDEFCDAYKEMFPDGSKIEEVLWVRCERNHYACGDYVDTLPQGRRIRDVEALLWHECENGNCWMYVRTFRNGPHIEVARARAEEEERQDQRRRDADAAIHHARWSGPLISCELVLPEGTSPQAITVKLADEMLKPTATERLTYAIPAAERNVKICYEQSASSFDSATSCAEITLEPGRNRLPLSVVSIVVPKRYSGINCQLDETSLIYPNDERFYVMPGRHTVSCALYGGAHADHRSGSVAHLSSDSVRVPFDAPPEGGSVIIAYDVDGYQVSGRALVRRD